PAIAPGQGQTYDGHWWMKQSREFQIGFLSGYLVCRRDDLRLPDEHHFRSVYNAIEPLKWRYWETENRGELVLDGMRRIQGETSPPLPGGDEWPEKYGYYDGLWWGDDDQSRGFLEGYFLCLPDAKTHYPGNVALYVKLI